MSKTPPLKSVVLLVAFDSAGQEVERAQLTIEEYYEGSSELIDSGEYRRAHGIRIARGQVYSPKGHLDQQFENRYAADGTLEYSQTVHADGTVTEHPRKAQ